MFKPVIFVLFISVFAFLSCSKTIDSQMHMYIETYYPTSGTFSYQIAFDSGEYDKADGQNIIYLLDNENNLFNPPGISKEVVKNLYQ